MPLCGFSESYSMFDATPLENIFIEEFMPRAPGDYVKVYLYGLKLCYHQQEGFGLPAFARSLGLEEGVVRDAFTYWEKQGTLRRMSDNPPTYAYINLKARLFGRGSMEDQQLYSYKNFNSSLQAIFGARILKPADYTRATEWIEDLKMSAEAVLLMVRYAVESKGTKVTFAYLDKIAVEWARGGIVSGDDAREYLRGKTAAYAGASSILKAMGLKRAPTVAEERMYTKWSDEWGFDKASVEEALDELTKISNPNFAYLDKVLESARNRGDTGGVRGGIEAYDARRKPVKELLETLGLKGSATNDLIMLYEDYLRQGFDPEAVSLVARLIRRRGNASIQQLSESLARYKEMGLMTGADMEKYMRELDRERDVIRAFKSHMGDDGDITPSDVRLYRNMEKSGLNAQTLALAAEYARGAREPMQFAARIVSNWKEQGITDVYTARAEHDARTNSGNSAAETIPLPSQPKARGKAFKEVSAQKFTQREYNDSDIDALMLDIGLLGEGDEK